jgi:hypothetical protein
MKKYLKGGTARNRPTWTHQRRYSSGAGLTRSWHAKTRLAGEYAASGKAALYQVLEAFQPGEQRSLSHRQAAQHLATSESAVKTLIHRMRKRHQELVRDEIAQTVADAGDVDDELRHLIAVLSR